MSVFDIFENNLKSKLDDRPIRAGQNRVLPRLAIQTEKPTISLRLQLAIKRLIDIVLSSFFFVAFSPFLVFIFILVRIDSGGPAIFSQYRWGKDGKLIKVYKFRSMRIEDCDPTGVEQTTENDPRLTSIGAFLRTSNIDELPQFWNVLKGDMSLVGPRCHVPGMLAAGMPYEDLVSECALRHQVRPGLTGLAQVRGFRGPTVKADKARARIASDLFYIDHFSLWLDIKIMVATILVEFRGGRGF